MRAAMASKKKGKCGSPARKSVALMAFYLEKEVDPFRGFLVKGKEGRGWGARWGACMRSASEGS